MTLHPGVRRDHHGPTAAGVRRRTPATTSRCGSSSPTRCARCSSASAPTRTSTWCCSRSTRRSSRASSRRWPASTRRSTSARRGGSSTPPTRSGASARAVTETAGFSRTSGFIDDTRAFCSIPARHDMSRRLDAGVPGPAGRRAPARRGRGARDGGRPRDGPPARGRSSCERQALRASRSRPGRGAGPARAPRARQLLPRPPGLVHRARAGRRRVGHRRLHRRGAPRSADALTAQDGLYTLVTRGRRRRPLRRASAASSGAHAAADHDAWLGYLASPEVRVVTSTVTEAGYLRGADGGLDRDRPEVQADVDALRARPGAPVRTAPARLVAGLAARRRADAGPLAARAVRQPARQRRRGRPASSATWRETVDPALAAWMADARRVSSRRWSTGSRPRPRRTTSRRGVEATGRRRPRARSSPSRSASG